MNARWPRWTEPLILVTYVLVSNLALASQSRLWATVAVALFVLLLIPIVAHTWARILIAGGGLCLVLGVARGLVPPIPLLLPPVVVPAAIGWLFGRTLWNGPLSLVERFAVAVSAPQPLDAEHGRYARGVTLMWTCVLAFMAVCNLVLVMSLSPGGLLEQLGFEPAWTVSTGTFLWLTNSVYLLIPAILVGEYFFRLHRFPDYPLRNLAEFARRARERLPAVVKEASGG